MKAKLFLYWSGAAGLFVATLFLFGMKIAPYFFDPFIFTFWPGSILLLGAGSIQTTYSSLLIYGLTILSNVILYAFLGFLLWVSIFKSKWFLFLFVAIIIALWFEMPKRLLVALS